jgi:hypothetical protein
VSALPNKCCEPMPQARYADADDWFPSAFPLMGLDEKCTGENATEQSYSLKRGARRVSLWSENVA